MASADYWLCDHCGRKAFYDANLDYSDDLLVRSDGRLLPTGCGDAQVLCIECSATHEVVVRLRGVAKEPQGEVGSGLAQK